MPAGLCPAAGLAFRPWPAYCWAHTILQEDRVYVSRKPSKKMQHSIETLDVVPHFDMEQFMLITQTRRLDEESARIIDEYWERWREQLRVRRIGIGQNDYVLVWLEPQVEEEITSLWETAPSRAFSVNNLAMAMLMAVIRDLVPEVAAAGCAPVPVPGAKLRKALKDVGVSWPENGILDKQYAMITHMPFKGGCAICHLKDECPNAGKAAAPQA